ncbi:pimeloyl-ACP methyl esterase BioG family protein [Ruegeria lacuscaerulensis]|uniref:pimeloyl-ACP methyl esterase BioG family protein n=1 Tax=Ruegeria lacuscaerulensis TaxID=55218 RepID=UPI001481CFF3|nr:pimeloyl-ACP methyl esterase BioG family protein [Ruegeria lacuscaerulensis]
MKAVWLSHSGVENLTLVFGGWALGPAPFAELEGGGDVLFVDDYTQLDAELPELADYDRLDVLAFSFGVASAVHWLEGAGVNPDRLVAVSGTLFPADAEKGIAPDMINATADNLSAASFAKFCRRAGFEGPAPQIDIHAAQAELRAILQRGPALARRFDRVWIPHQDRIIPTKAQEAAWQSSAIRRIDGPHVPFRAGQSWAEWLA